MSSKAPIVRQVAWLAVVPQMMIVGLLMLLFHFAGASEPVIFGASAYLALSIGLRLGITRAHRRGIALVKKKQYAAAAPEFESSYEFFARHKWIDRFRFVTLLSASRVSYREMALLNMAFGHAQAGNGSRAKELYERALVEFQDSEMAKTSLKLIESVEKSF